MSTLTGVPFLGMAVIYRVVPGEAPTLHAGQVFLDGAAPGAAYPRDLLPRIPLSYLDVQAPEYLWWASGSNVFAFSLAAGVLAAWGVLLTPALGAVLMSASTVIVAINAQLQKGTAP